MKKLLTGEKRNIAICASATVFGAVAFFVLLWKLPEAGRAASAFVSAAAPVIVGLGLAFVLNIPVSLAEGLLGRLGLGARAARRTATVAVLLLIGAGLGALMALVLPRLIESLRTLAENAETYLEQAKAMLKKLISGFRSAPEAEALTERITGELEKRAAGFTSELLPKLPGMTFSAVAAGYKVVLTIVICIHSLAHKEGLLRFSRRASTALLPKKRIPGFFRGCALANRTFRRYVSAQLISALIIGALGFIGMRVLRLPYPELASVFCAVGALVPIVGPWVSIGASAFIIFMSAGSGAAVRFLVLMLSIQLAEDNLIYPRVIGGAIGLTGLEVLAAVIISGGIFGLPGLLVAVPTTAVARKLIRSAVDARNAARAEAGETA